MILLSHNRKFDCVEIHGARYPVDETSITNQVFFRVAGMGGQQKFYMNPEEYYDSTVRRPRNGEDDEASHTKWGSDRQAFLQKHSAWYDRIDRIKNDVAGWLANSKIEKRGYQIGTQPYVV